MEHGDQSQKRWEVGCFDLSQHGRVRSSVHTTGKVSFKNYVISFEEANFKEIKNSKNQENFRISLLSQCLSRKLLF